MSGFFGWLNDQFLRMEWLSELVAHLLAATGLDVTTPVGGSIHFFIYDIIKFFILLSVLIFAISWNGPITSGPTTSWKIVPMTDGSIAC
jgi:hypothetical protein